MDPKHTSENHEGGRADDLPTVRKELDAALTRLRQFESLVNQAPAVMFVLQVAEGWPVEYVSESISRFGYTARELLSGEIPSSRIIHHEDLPRLEAEIAKYIERGGTEYSQDYRLITRSGNIRWVEDHNVVVRNAEGQATHIRCMLFDITERKEAEIALRDSERQHKAFLENVPIGIYRTTPDGRILMANPALVAMLGYSSSDELATRNLESNGFEPGYPRSQFKELIELHGKISDFESAWTMRDGSTVFVRENGTAVRDQNGEILFYEGIVEDITEQKEAEEALRRSEEKYRTLVSNVNIGVYRNTAGPHGEFLEANPAIARIFGFDSVKEFMEVAVSDLYINPNDRGQFVEKILRSGSVRDEELRLHRKDGTPIWASCTAQVAYDDDGNIKWLDGALEDITERKEAEEELKDAHAKLMIAREQERGRLAGELHDSIGQQLVALGLQLDNASRSDKGRESVHAPQFLAAVESCNRLIRDVREICHGLYPPALESLGLVSALGQFEGHCLSAGLEAAVRCDPSIIRARFGLEVELALFRIAQEAVSNAIRHSKADHLDIDLMREGGRLVLAVVNDGEGFDVQTAEGQGLGLSSMRDRARAIAADFSITSEPGETRVEVAVEVAFEPQDTARGD